MPSPQLLEAIRSQPVNADALPVVSLEQFFEGNDDLGSIGCNLDPHPGLATFSSVLREIRGRAEVQAVLVGISEDMGDDEWPFSDSVYVLTTASLEQVARWAQRLKADVAEGWLRAAPPLAPALLPDHRVVTLWWD